MCKLTFQTSVLPILKTSFNVLIKGPVTDQQTVQLLLIYSFVVQLFVVYSIQYLNSNGILLIQVLAHNFILIRSESIPGLFFLNQCIL